MPPSPTHRVTSDDLPSPTVSVVIPALNEERTLPLVLEGLPPVHEVIVVDGGSADDTIAVAREVRPDAVIVRQTRTGKGNALACGFAASSSDIVVTLNADGSADPGELPRFVDALLSGAEVAHGSRFRNGGAELDGHALGRLGNRMFSQVVNLFFGTRFTDLGYGYNAYWRSLLPSLELPEPQLHGLPRGRRVWGDGPEIETLINIRMAALGLRVVEVASVGYPRLHGNRPNDALIRAQLAVQTATAEYLRCWRTPARTGASPYAGVQSSTARPGTQGPEGVPSAQSRSAGTWPADLLPVAEHADGWPDETPATPRRKPGPRIRAEDPAPQRATPSAHRRQRHADQAAGIEPDAATWVEDEGAMGRHSADDGERRDLGARPDRRRGYLAPLPGETEQYLEPGAGTRSSYRDVDRDDYLAPGRTSLPSYGRTRPATGRTPQTSDTRTRPATGRTAPPSDTTGTRTQPARGAVANGWTPSTGEIPGRPARSASGAAAGWDRSAAGYPQPDRRATRGRPQPGGDAAPGYVAGSRPGHADTSSRSRPAGATTGSRSRPVSDYPERPDQIGSPARPPGGDTGSPARPPGWDTGSHARPPGWDTGSHARPPGWDTGSHARPPGWDTGSHARP
ncbi:MAG: hypothetical protein QOC94_1691, partial [Actinoplanes sp.]|nr:hypothetical protein [Actinoplanes sp.]